ncbi:hypothetical protein F5051DRAFT_447802 [Lentinula edodes]|nr:hypothetical protein F5051DRAFT_447802 [Lentinula edodes]
MPTALLLPKLWDLDHVEATPHVEPRTAFPLPLITLEEVHPPAQSPGTYPHGRIPSRELTTSRLIPINDLSESYIDVLASTTPTTQYHKEPPQGSPLFAPATTRSFLSSVAVPVAPFELQPAPSTLQHKPSYTKPYLKAYSDPGLTLYQALPSKIESKKQKSALSHGNTTQAQKSNQAASSTVITVAAGQRLMSIPEQLFGDETANNIWTAEGRQPEVQGPPPVEPGMGPPQRRYTSMGYTQPASSPMGGFAYSPTWGTGGPPPGPESNGHSNQPI